MSKYQYVYVMKGLTKSYNHGAKVVFKDIYLSFLPGAKIGIIGPNGAGKSSLLRIMAGEDQDFIGESWAADGIKIGYLPQEPQLDTAKNVLANIMEGVSYKANLLNRFNEVSVRLGEEMTPEEMESLINEQAELQDKIEAANAWDIEREIEIAMDALRCPAKDADVNILSGGEKRRVALCKLLLEKPDMLLLDEPTNHLDAESVAWLENYLKEYAGTVVLITHDRYFLDNVTNWILELDRGQGMPWEGNYSSWLEQKAKKLFEEEKSESDREKQLRRELEWINQSPKARQAKSKARITSYEKLRDQERSQNVGIAKIVIPDGPRLGELVIEVSGLSKSYDKSLINDLSFNLPKGAIVGIIGPNGVGKTTLFRLLTQQIKPDQGNIRLGDAVQLGYVDQSRDSLDGKRSVWEEISDAQDDILLGKTLVKSRAYCSSFNFKGSDQQKIVGQLSGGERNRVHLAKMLKSGANVILLDEPTNDLDVDTLRALEEALLEFSGCVMIISHDRWFLDRIATHILAFEDAGIVWYEGNYQEYEVDKKQRLGIDEVNTSSVRFKKLV